MRSMKQRVMGVGVMMIAVLGGAAAATAQPLGPFHFRLAPFDELLTLTVAQEGGVLVISGWTDAGTTGRFATYGTAFLRADGTIGMGLTTVFEGVAAQTSVVLDPATLSGTWRDDGGQSGQFLPQ